MGSNFQLFEMDNLEHLTFALRNPIHQDVDLEAMGPVLTYVVMKLKAIEELLQSKDNAIYLLGHQEDVCTTLDLESISNIYTKHVKKPMYAGVAKVFQQQLSTQMSAFASSDHALNVVCSQGIDFDMVLVRTGLVRSIVEKHSSSYDDAVKSLLKALHANSIVASEQFLHDLLSEQ